MSGEQLGGNSLLLPFFFASIMAEFNRRSGGHIGYASHEKFIRDKGRFWHEFVVTKARDWEDMNTD